MNTPLRWAGIAVAALFMAGCATTPPRPGKPSPISPATALPETHAPQRLIVFIPLTEASAVSAIKLLERLPHLRMTVCLSPRFTGFKEPALKARATALLQSHRLELGVQLPNPPIVPLLMDSNSAKNSATFRGEPPAPAFAFPEDVVQIIARTKADYFRIWGSLPRGISLPYGAASPPALALLDQQGFAWAVAALGAPATGGVYKTGALLVWDAAPVGTSATSVQVFDERVTKEGGLAKLESWAQALAPSGAAAILPSDSVVDMRPLQQVASRTWTQPSWASWIGDAHKNAAWQWLRKTREALESYKNSGNAALSHLDLAFEEIYSAENANYFLIPPDLEPSPAAEERLHEFQATLSTVFRLIGRAAPDDLFSTPRTPGNAGTHLSSTTATTEITADKTEHVAFTDAAGDNHGDGKLPEPPEPHAPGSYDLQKVDVWASSETLTWTVSFGAPGTPLVDFYVDLNGQPGLGTVPLLPGRNLSAAPSDAWEYALTLYKSHAVLYRTLGGGTFDLVGSFPVVTEGATQKIIMPRSTIHGSPRKWGYQVLVMARDPASPELSPRPWSALGFQGPPIYDLLDPLDVPQAQLLSDIETGVRSDLPFVRVAH